MTFEYNQKNRSPCKKFKQMMRNILNLSSSSSSSSLLLPGTEGRSSSFHSSPLTHQPVVKRPKNQAMRRPDSSRLGGLHGGGSSSFIKIHGNDQHDMRAHDLMQRGELNNSVINLQASDYIRRFHERNKHDSL